jgi:hypothetical protein
MRTFSSTVMLPKRRMFWNVRAMPSLLACTAFMPAVSLPSRMTTPVVGW